MAGKGPPVQLLVTVSPPTCVMQGSMALAQVLMYRPKLHFTYNKPF